MTCCFPSGPLSTEMHCIPPNFLYTDTSKGSYHISTEKTEGMFINNHKISKSDTSTIPPKLKQTQRTK